MFRGELLAAGKKSIVLNIDVVVVVFDFINLYYTCYDLIFWMFSLIIAPLLSLLFTGLLTNFFSFTSYSYKVGLIRTLVDRTFKITNTWSGFHKDVMNLVRILKKNLFSSHLIENTINSYVTKAVSSAKSFEPDLEKTSTYYFKIPYVGFSLR